jgi:putative hydrolase of the HAD superfamily
VRRVRAVTVDFWGTLITQPPQADDRYRERRLADFRTILRRVGLTVSPAALGRGYEHSARELESVWARNRDLPPLRHVASILEGARAGLSARVPRAVVDELVEAYARPALLVPPPADTGAGEGLRALAARGIRLAVVSNTMRTPGRALRRMLEHHGLLAPFAHLTFSDEVGVRKPAAEIFHLALRALGAEPGESVHVGDDAMLDVHGARRAGMRAVQVVAGGKPGSGEQAPDLVIADLGELPRAIAALESAA